MLETYSVVFICFELRFLLLGIMVRGLGAVIWGELSCSITFNGNDLHFILTVLFTESCRIGYDFTV